MKVRIAKCSDESIWYSDRIGELYDVYHYDANFFRVVNGQEYNYSIYVADCEVLSDTHTVAATPDMNEPADMVNEPPHYRQGGIECIDAIRAALTDEEFRGYCKGNSIAYIWRERHKGGDEDLRKGQWHLNKLTETI